MELLAIILNDPDKLKDVASGLVEAGVTGATIMESQGLGKLLSHDIPIFAGFRQMMSSSKPFNYVILSVINDPQVARDALSIINDILGPRETHAGVLFTVPVSFFTPLGKPLPKAAPEI